VLRVSGTVTFTNTEIRGAPIGTVGYAGVLPNGPVMDMSIVIGQNVRFQSPTLRASFVGALEVNGTPREPSIIGRVSTRDGQIRFPSAAARITEGEVTVSVTRDPVTNLIRSRADIEAVATGQVDRYRITIALRGPLDFGSQSTQNLRIDVTSDPPLSQDEAFAQLIGTSLRDLEVDRFGNPVGNSDVDRANQVYARAIVSVLSAPLFAGIERTLEDVLGLNSITLDYRFNEPLSVQLGKAIGDRVYVTYRRSLSANRPGQTPAYDLRVDYRIKGGLLLGVQTDERGRQQLTLQKTFRF
jgi:autotransporter translocation and assembly factor TamB